MPICVLIAALKLKFVRTACNLNLHIPKWRKLYALLRMKKTGDCQNSGSMAPCGPAPCKRHESTGTGYAVNPCSGLSEILSRHVGTRYYASWVLLCGSFDTAWRLSGTRSLFVNTHGYLTAPHRVMTAMVVTWCLILGLLGLRLLLVLSASYTVCNKNVAQRTHVLKYELWRYSHTAETEITENECIK